MSSNNLATLSQKTIDELLYYLLEVAIQCSDEEAIHWTKLELGGYTKENSELRETDKVPAYRTVIGQYYDAYNRPIGVADSRLAFLLEYPIRDSLPELQAYSEKDGLLEIQDFKRFELIAEKFSVRPHCFRFPVTAVSGILGAIRTQALDKIHNLRISEPLGTTNDDTLNGLHSRVKEVAGKLFQDGHYRQAILDTYIALVEQVKAKSGRYDLDGSTLMQQVFSPKSPKIIVSDDSDEQMGYMWMFSGAVMGIRNPKAHRLIQQTDPQKTVEWLSFASVLFKVLDDAQVAGGTP
ncbi:TIGR02391 family protein [Ferroacidibacillus organovorans]|uniref:TIGR02391 family protein n=1 Tax=Ferroacidibacillus organovorans TaxID=1765683 RepID=A0A853K8D1_9BACL|nr:TIGR02391 family protein [Ferroacidibacillus organovorans]KYP79230.1 hypothetical protein AYJ22_15320 [Ferroacidibacillus organovorans]OAG86827.1 hypothetical protein AYW79_14805 [Ferroacidibacillus organovorans]